MSRRRILWIGCTCLLAVWSLAAAAIWVARSLTPRAAPVIALAGERPLAGLTANERRALLDRLADAIDRLQPDERREVQMSAAVRALYPQMTTDERQHFLARTRPPGSEAISKAFDAAASFGPGFQGGGQPRQASGGATPARPPLPAPPAAHLPQEPRSAPHALSMATITGPR